MTRWGGRTVARTRAALAMRDTQPDGTLICPLCDQPIRPGQPVQVDHIHGRGLGGGHALANLRLTHATCNNRRGHIQQRVIAVARAARTAEPGRWAALADRL
jgi:5-methylcytosine-specific restriction endonuclease McrA